MAEEKKGDEEEAPKALDAGDIALLKSYVRAWDAYFAASERLLTHSATWYHMSSGSGPVHCAYPPA